MDFTMSCFSYILLSIPKLSPTWCPLLTTQTVSDSMSVVDNHWGCRTRNSRRRQTWDPRTWGCLCRNCCRFLLGYVGLNRSEWIWQIPFFRVAWCRSEVECFGKYTADRHVNRVHKRFTRNPFEDTYLSQQVVCCFYAFSEPFVRRLRWLSRQFWWTICRLHSRLRINELNFFIDSVSLLFNLAMSYGHPVN